VVIVCSHSESFGLTALEAHACGTPIVATTVGGLSQVVKNGRLDGWNRNVTRCDLPAGCRAGYGRSSSAPFLGGRTRRGAVILMGTNRRRGPPVVRQSRDGTAAAGLRMLTSMGLATNWQPAIQEEIGEARKNPV
jgi:hypothetical protein